MARRYALKKKSSPRKTKAPARAEKKRAKDRAPDLLETRAARGGKPRETQSSKEYGAQHIEGLEGLEPGRRRPGMYIGGTDEKAMHHLFAEVIDNAMDEAVAGHATYIEVEMEANGFITVTDNGRGIPGEAHPKFKKKSALEG